MNFQPMILDGLVEFILQMKKGNTVINEREPRKLDETKIICLFLMN
jgi:hypothetical protein